MGRRAVVTLLVILDGQFPVGRYVVNLVRRDFQVLEVEHGHRFGEFRFHFVEAWRRVRETDENEPVDQVERDRMQVVTLFVESITHTARGHQVAVYVVHPAVIRAHEFVRMACLVETHQ